MGRAELRELLDEGALAALELELQRLDATRPGARRRRPARPAARARRPDDARGRRARRGRCRGGDVARRARSAPRRVLARPHRAARSAGSPSRTPRATATRSAWRCRSACRTRSSSRSPIPLGDLVARYARTHGPFARCRRRRRASGSPSPWSSRRCTRSRWTAAWSTASSGPAAAAASGSTSRSCAGCDDARSPRSRREVEPGRPRAARALRPRVARHRRGGRQAAHAGRAAARGRAAPGRPAAGVGARVADPAGTSSGLRAGAARPARRRGRAGVGWRRRARAQRRLDHPRARREGARCCFRIRVPLEHVARWRSGCSTSSPAVARSSSASSPRPYAPATTPSCCWRCGIWCGRGA